MAATKRISIAEITRQRRSGPATERGIVSAESQKKSLAEKIASADYKRILRDERFSTDPRITLEGIAKRISVNTSAATLLGKAVAVELLYDADQRLLGIKVADPESPHALKVEGEGSSPRSRGGGFRFAAKSFLSSSGLATEETRRFAVVLHDGILHADLDDPIVND